MKFPTKMYINGKLTSSSINKPVFNPATEKKVSLVSTAGLSDVERALQAAKNAFPHWSTAPIAVRQKWMKRLRDQVIKNEDFLRECIHYEMGKPWSQTHEDWDRLVASLDFYSEEI